MANPSVFEDYFRRADTDNDGRISGREAVAFFQGANLPQVTLAKIWQFADQGSTGFLSKLEFHNALKLVTVAQTGRELTPEIVRAALAGPAAAQIPAPRIITPTSQPPSYPATQAPPPQAAVGNGSFPDQFSSGPGAPPRSWSSQPSSLPTQTSGPPPAIPRPGSATGQRPSGGFVSDTWPSIRSASGSSAAPPVPVTAPAYAPSYQAGETTGPSQSRKDAPGGQPGSDNFFSGASASKPTPTSFTSASLVDAFGGDPFAAKAIVSVPPKLPAASQGFGDFGDAGFRAESATMALVPTSLPARDTSKDTQQAPTLTRSVVPAGSASMGQGFGAPPSAVPGLGGPWPRMTPSDMQRYTRVFAEVDTDRDGRITGEQARDLFLSWRLPREVLKQVWDLSDQDGDSMLSMREFCTALYLMERFREGRPLPPVLPPGIFADDKQPESYQPGATMQQGRPAPPNNQSRYNVPNWQQNAGGISPTDSGFAPNSRPIPPSAATTAAIPNSTGGVGDSQAGQYKSKAPVLEMHLVNQLSRDEQDTLKSRHNDAEEADKKAYELDKEIMDYKEKAEFYRSKLQEIILFKSRCENRLGEITERASADKREMESLAKKYDERFKAAGEVNSRLLAEEAAFRDIQEKKIELYNAIAKMEQGGDANGLLQSKADRIASDLDELKKALNERAKRLGLNVKATAPTEQQFGWQPGLQDKAAEWDEDWDKFDDEGFVSVQDFMDDATGGNLAASTPKPTASWDESSPFEDGFSSFPEPGPTVEIPKEHAAADLASPQAGSESGRSGLESPTHDVSTSSSQAVEKGNHDQPANASKASQRYANLTESQEDVFNGPTSYSSTTNSDTFGDGGVSWSAAFSHDEEVDSGVRASWGLQSNPPSTQASLDVTGSRASRFGKTGLSSHGFGDSLDLGSMHVSSPGRVIDVSSPTPSHGGNGFRDSQEYDGFGPLGSSKDFDNSPKFFGGNHNTHLGSTLFDSPRKSSAGNDRSFARFDSFASPQNNPAFPGIGDDHHDNSHIGAGNQFDRSFARFDSISSVKGDGANGRNGAFQSFDDGDDLFATGPFSAGGQEKKSSERGWSAF